MASLDPFEKRFDYGGGGDGGHADESKPFPRAR